MFNNKDNTGTSDRCEGTACMWSVFTAIFLATTLILTATILFLIISNPDLHWSLSEDKSRDTLVPVGGGGATGEGGGRHRSKESNVFAELSQTEIEGVLKFLLNDEDLHITPSGNATTLDNYIYMMEIKQPSKSAMLVYLNEAIDKPPREATVILLMGDNTPEPNVLEIVVSPLPNPITWEHRANYRWNLRPRLAPAEVKSMDAFLKIQTMPIKNSMKRVFGFGFANCFSQCLEWTFTTPPVPATNLRNTWITFRRPHSGSALHALPLYMLVEDQHRNPENWRILKIVYKTKIVTNMQIFKTILEDEIVIPDTSQAAKSRTSLQKRNTESSSPPETMGKGRHLLDGERVSYFHWNFEFRHRISSGLQLFDIRFNQVRVVYELSIQGIMSFYSGNDPFMMHARYLENQEPLGYSTSELIPGLDCPNNADFFDGYYYDANTGKSKLRKGYVCIFEHNTDIPLKRHRSKSGNEYGGIPGTSLIVRSIQTFRETDFIFDVIFYNNGALETRFYTSGYPLGTFWGKENVEDDMFGYPISESQLSPVSTHLVNYKVDLDIGGTINRHAVNEIDLYSGADPYFPGEEIVQRRLTKSVKFKELDSLYTHSFSDPKLLLFYNEESKNRFGKHKAYRLTLDGIAKNLEIPGWKWENGVSWARYQMAVTRHDDDEQRSSVMYDAMDPYEPVGSFQGFVGNNENIIDQDLVAWVTVGTHRVPSTSDVPLASTLDTSGGFKLLPFNFFEEDPSRDHPDWIYKRD